MNNTEWETEFENLPETGMTTKEFIKSLLSRHESSLREELAGETRKMKRQPAGLHGDVVERDNCFYNLALDAVLARIEKKV